MVLLAPRARRHDMTTIRQADLIQSIADAFQFLSFYHPADTDKDNPLRASVLADPDDARKSTRDNTPAVVHGNAVHESGSREWRAKIGRIPVTVA